MGQNNSLFLIKTHIHIREDLEIYKNLTFGLEVMSAGEAGLEM
jgi:hypothetical protein